MKTRNEEKSAKFTASKERKITAQKLGDVNTQYGSQYREVRKLSADMRHMAKSENFTETKVREGLGNVCNFYGNEIALS